MKLYGYDEKNKKNSYLNQIKLGDTANIYIQGIAKDYLNFRQKHKELLVEYRAETDSLNKQISKANVKN